MGDSDSTINNNLQDNHERESMDTVSLTDFPITQDQGGSSTFQDDRNSPSLSAADDFFEFLSDYSDESMMSHAEDIIFCGKLVPINEQRHLKNPPEKKEKILRRNQHNQFKSCRRSESMSEVKSTTMSPFVRYRNSRSLDYKKLHRNSSMSSEQATEIRRDGSGKKYSSSRWCVHLFFGLVKVPPPEMDLHEMKIRQVRRTTSKTCHSPESCNAVSVSRSENHRNCSSRVLGFLSCKSSASVSATVTTPLRNMPRV